MEARKVREQEFHDVAFADGKRAVVGKFYQVTGASRIFYEGFLTSHCANRQVLEYGCGPGSAAFLLGQLGARVSGIDISPVAISQAEEEARRLGLSGLSFQVMDAEALTFPDRSFDLICGSGILHHLDLHRAYAQLARVLRPDGHAIFLEPLGHNPMIRLYRHFTPSLRTSDEHPLLMADLELLRRYFGQVETHFFHLSSLMAVPFRRLPVFEKLVSTLESVDQTLFERLPAVRKHAWIVVIVLSAPLSA